MQHQPLTEYVTPTPTDFYAAPARVIEHVAPAPVIEHSTPPPAVTFFTPCQQLPPETMATTDASSDTTSFVNPQFSTTAVEASASQVSGSLLLLDEFAVRNRSLHCARASHSHPGAHCGSIQVIPGELFPERIEEQIVDSPVPASAEEIMEVVQIIAQDRFQ